jgi:citrate lyase subunit beta/citryl-CoA lyase
MRRAREIVAAFETARAKGEARVEIDGSLVEVPTYANARRLLARGEALREFERKKSIGRPIGANVTALRVCD